LHLSVCSLERRFREVYLALLFSGFILFCPVFPAQSEARTSSPPTPRSTLVATNPASPKAVMAQVAGISLQKARRKMRDTARAACHSVEKTRLQFHFPFDLPPPLERNGFCKSISVGKVIDCEAEQWTIENPDPAKRGRSYWTCPTTVQWYTTKWTWYGFCWRRAGSPRDENIYIRGRRSVSVGVDIRGGLLVDLGPWSSCSWVRTN
jgi:hypothetical protein